MAQTVTYGVQLDTSGLVTGADQAAKAIDELNASIKAEQQDIGAMQKSLKLLGKETDANRDHVKRLKDAIDLKRKSVSDAALDVQKLGGAYGFAKKPANDFRKGMQELGNQAKDLGGPVGQLASRMEQLSKFAGSSRAKFILGAAGIAAIGAAAIGASVKMFNFAQELSEAKDKELRDLGGFLSLQKGVKDFQKDGEALQGIIGKIAHNSAASKEEVTGVAKELISAGISGKHLENALEAANMASVVAGSEGVKAFIEQSKAAKAHGQSIESVATKFRTKYGPSAKAALLSSDALAKRFKDNIQGMFTGINFTPLAEAKKRFVDLFDTNTMLGKSIQGAIKPWIQGISDFFASATDFAADFIVDWIIGVKRIQIAYYDVKIALKEFSQSLFRLGFAISDWVDSAGKKLGGWLTDLKTAWQQFDAKQLGIDIINGILNGLKAGWEMLKQGVTKLATGVQDTFKSVLGIHSPSLVFKELGMQLPRGLEQGINAEKPRAERAISDLIPVSLGDQGNSGNRSISIVFNPSITIQSTGNTTEDVGSLESQLNAMLQRMAQQVGAVLA